MQIMLLVRVCQHKRYFRETDQVFLPEDVNSDHISVGSSNGDFELDEIIKNTNEKIKTLFNLGETEFEKTNVNCTKELDKKNIWLLPNKISLGIIYIRIWLGRGFA